MTIVNDNSSVVSKWSFKLIDDPRVVIYDRHSFIIQATGCQYSFRYILSLHFRGGTWGHICTYHGQSETITKRYRILSSIMRIQVKCAPEFHNDFWQNIFILFLKHNFIRTNHSKFIHHKRHLIPSLSYLAFIVRREYFSIIFNVKKCTLYSIKYSLSLVAL